MKGEVLYVRRKLRTLTTTVALAVLAPLLSGGSAAADPAPSPYEETQTEETRALEAAAASGDQVEIMSWRTETSQVFANPDGSFTEDTYVLPQFVRQSSRLVPIDTDLAANPDGTFSPQAAEVGVRFSGGGDAPAVTVTRDGRSMSWTWPEALPDPTVAGDTATYPNVLEDVDLRGRFVI